VRDARVEYGLYGETDSDWFDYDATCRLIQGQTAGLQRNIPMDMSLLDVVAAVAAVFRRIEAATLIRCADPKSYLVSAERDGAPVAAAAIAVVSSRGAIFDPRTKGQYYFNVAVRCLLDDLPEIAEGIEARLAEVHLATIEWWFRQGQRTNQHHMLMAAPPRTLDVGYPWIEGGLEAYFERYLASDAAALFMSGPPGTGKTSFLRHFLWINKRHAMVTYEEDLLAGDELFIALLGSDADTLIIEDADTMLAPRKTSGNKMMGRFLATSDGIIKFPKKKIIFTTNLEDFSKIDPALLRPGRCFDSLIFRALSFEEAVACAAAYGLPAPSARRDYSIAELFNPAGPKKPDHSVGFRAG